MQIATSKAKCASCGSEFSSPYLSDFSYGEFLFTGEKGNVFAYFNAIGHPVWEFVKSAFPSGGDDRGRKALGARIQAGCAYIADPVNGQQLVDQHVCPMCQSRNWEWWGGERVGWIEVADVTYKNFLSQPETERRRVILELDKELFKAHDSVE
jgi:hypothetical protein